MKHTADEKTMFGSFPMIGKRDKKVSNDWKNGKKCFQWLEKAFLAFLLMGMSAQGATYYVDAGRPDDSGDGLSWATAKNSIQAAVDCTAAGDAVVVTNGRYEISSEIHVVRPISISSVNGADATIVDANSTCRGFNLGNVRCLLSGFTITEGYHATSGGGVFCIYTNPVISECVFDGNMTRWEAGGLRFGTAIDCTFYRNKADWGAGQRFGSAEACLFEGNAAAASGGGMSDGSAVRCEFKANTAVQDGGGAHKSRVEACLFTDNRSARGAGLNQGKAVNCTFSGNNSTNGVGAVRFSELNNSISWPDGWAADCEVSASCSNDPIFAGADHGDYRLSGTSPCLNAGNNALVSGTVDMDGDERIAFSVVDQGAYEWQGDLSSVHGQAFGGDELTITLENSGQNVTNVMLCGVPAVIISQNYHEIVVQTGPSPDPDQTVLGALVVQTSTGETITLAQAFTYEMAGRITSVTPSVGPVEGGTYIKILGTNLTATPVDVSQITICGQPGATPWVQPHQIMLYTSAGMTPGLGDVVVESALYGRIVASNAFTAKASQAITNTAPADGASVVVGGRCDLQRRCQFRAGTAVCQCQCGCTYSLAGGRSVPGAADRCGGAGVFAARQYRLLCGTGCDQPAADHAGRGGDLCETRWQ